MGISKANKWQFVSVRSTLLHAPFGVAKKFPAPQEQITDCPELRRAIAFRLRQAYAETGGVAQNGLILSEDGIPTITPAEANYL